MKRARGLTLIEVLVVSSVFLAMLAALWLIYEQTMRVERTVSLKVDVDREIFAAVRHVDASLKSSRLVTPADWSHPQAVDTIQLLPWKGGTDGQPLLTAAGFPQWGSPFNISFSQGELVRSSDSRRLANLGASGLVSFRRLSQGMLEMEIKAEKTGFRGQTTSRDLIFQLRLFNQ